MLTDEEETILHLASLRGTTTEMTFARDELKTAVASIIASRVRAARAQELRDASDDVDLSRFYDPNPLGQVSQECGHAETAVHKWLRDRAETIENELG